MSTQLPPADPTLEECREYVATVTRDLSLWASGSAGFWTAIRVAEFKGSADAMGASDRFHFARSRRTWQDAQGVMVRWGHERGVVEPFSESLSPYEKVWEQAADALRHAARRPQVDAAVNGTYIGHWGYETYGRTIRFPATRDLGIEAWEHSVDPYFKEALPDISAVQSEIESLRSWARSRIWQTTYRMSCTERRAEWVGTFGSKLRESSRARFSYLGSH